MYLCVCAYMRVLSIVLFPIFTYEFCHVTPACVQYKSILTSYMHATLFAICLWNLIDRFAIESFLHVHLSVFRSTNLLLLLLLRSIKNSLEKRSNISHQVSKVSTRDLIDKMTPSSNLHRLVHIWRTTGSIILVRVLYHVRSIKRLLKFGRVPLRFL